MSGRRLVAGRLAALVALAAAALLAVAGAAPPAAPAATLSISGSSTMLPLVADLAYFYRRHASRPPRIELRGGGSEIGAADALRRIVSIGMVSRDREPGDPRTLVFTPIAYSGVCLVTNRANPLPGLTRAQLQDLVAARVTRWEELPGAAPLGEIDAAGLAVGTGARSTFLGTFVDDGTPVAYRPRSFTTARAVRAHVLATPNAWGYVDVAFTGGLHVVPFEGVPCSRDAILSGAYPARRGLHLVTRGRPRGEAGRFIRWVRTSSLARRVIATRYLVPRGR